MPHCTEPRNVLRQFDVPESCAKLNFTGECNSEAVIRACQDDHTKSCHITKSSLCDDRSKYEATPYCEDKELLSIIEEQSTESDELVCSNKRAEFLQCVQFESVTVTETVEKIIIQNSIPWYIYVVIGMLVVVIGILVVVVLIGIAAFVFLFGVIAEEIERQKRLNLASPWLRDTQTLTW